MNFTARGLNMDNEGKSKSLIVSDKINVIAGVGAHTETY
jgi:hypothetical protein